MNSRFGEAPDWRDMVDEYDGWDDCVRQLATRSGIPATEAAWQLRRATAKANYGWMGWRRCWHELLARSVPPRQPAGEAADEHD